MFSLDQIIPSLPIWILCIIAILWAADKFVLPFFKSYRSVEDRDIKLADIKKQIDYLRVELHNWENKYRLLDEAYRNLQMKYNGIIGMLRGFQVYIKEKGMADFPLMDELVKHTGGEKPE